MYVREYMHTPVITCSPDTLIWDAQKIMSDNNIRRLPVVDGEKLVGIITQSDISKATPFSNASLMVSELNYFLSKLKVEWLMTKNVITVTPDTPLEEAVFLGQERQIGAFPVVDEGKIVGIITATDIYRLMVQALSFGKPGLRLHMKNVDQPHLDHVLQVILSHGAHIQSILRVIPPATGTPDVIIRLDPTDESKLVRDLRAWGYVVEARQK